MRKIEFGYSNDLNTKGSWQGIGINPEVFLTSANYYGTIAVGADCFVVSKVVEDEYGRYPELLNKFIVRDAIYDLYPDGSGTLMLDQEVSEYAKQLEETLNTSRIKYKIGTVNDIFKNVAGINKPNHSFELMENDMAKYPIIATSVRHSVFEKIKAKSLKSPLPQGRIR